MFSYNSICQLDKIKEKGTYLTRPLAVVYFLKSQINKEKLFITLKDI